MSLKLVNDTGLDVEWTPEIDMILSALDAAWTDPGERRSTSRLRYRVPVLLRLYSDLDDTPGWVLYTRDADPRGIGFITRQRLPLGYGGKIDLVTPDGLHAEIPCTILRCRPCVNDWFEGAIAFNRPQAAFRVWGDNA